MAQTVTFRPTPAQLLWLHRQRRERGIPVTTLVQLALEQAMGLMELETKINDRLRDSSLSTQNSKPELAR